MCVHYAKVSCTFFFDLLVQAVCEHHQCWLLQGLLAIVNTDFSSFLLSLFFLMGTHMEDLPEPKQEKAAGLQHRDFVLTVISRHLALVDG